MKRWGYRYGIEEEGKVFMNRGGVFLLLDPPSLSYLTIITPPTQQLHPPSDFWLIHIHSYFPFPFPLPPPPPPRVFHHMVWLGASAYIASLGENEVHVSYIVLFLNGFR